MGLTDARHEVVLHIFVTLKVSMISVSGGRYRILVTLQTTEIDFTKTRTVIIIMIAITLCE